jgi:hypothetical protein
LRLEHDMRETHFVYSRRYCSSHGRGVCHVGVITAISMTVRHHSSRRAIAAEPVLPHCQRTGLRPPHEFSVNRDNFLQRCLLLPRAISYNHPSHTGWLCSPILFPWATRHTYCPSCIHHRYVLPEQERSCETSSASSGHSSPSPKSPNSMTSSALFARAVSRRLGPSPAKSSHSARHPPSSEKAASSAR